jgi:dynein heavy chain 1
LDKLFTPKLFEHDYVLINDIDGKSTSLNAPEEATRDGILSWVNAIKSAQLPNWIGLPNNAEKVLLTVRGQELLRNLLKMSDDELAYDDAAGEEKTKTPSYLVVLADIAQRWLNTLPNV